MSSYSGVPDETSWRTSSVCDAGTCVGVARQGEFIVVANTATPGEGISRFTRDEWKAFIAGVKLGDFDDLA